MGAPRGVPVDLGLYLAGAAVTGSGLAVLLWGEWRGDGTVAGVAKMVASTGFLLAALGADATGGPYGRWVLGALALSWCGDALLIARDRKRFLAGLAVFLSAHILYVVAFFGLGLSPSVLPLGITLAAVLVLWRVVPWLWPHVPAAMHAPVAAYMAVITGMVIASGFAAAHIGWPVLLGAGLFYLSDLAVARERFVRPGFANRAVGLPLYYGGQLVLAATPALVA